MQAEDADRHAFEPVHIEGVDGVLIVGQLFGRTRQAEHIARRVYQQESVFASERLEQLLHLGRRDVAQRKQPRRHAGRRLRHAHFGDQLARHRLVRWQDHVAVALFDHRVVGPDSSVSRIDSACCLLTGLDVEKLTSPFTPWAML